MAVFVLLFALSAVLSEDQLYRQLDVARTAAAEKRISDTNVRGSRLLAESRFRGPVTGSTLEVMSAAKLGNSGFEKVWVIEDVEDLSAQLNFHTFQ